MSSFMLFYALYQKISTKSCSSKTSVYLYQTNQESETLLVRLYKDVGIPEMSAHLVDLYTKCFNSVMDHSLGESKVLRQFLTCYKCYLDIGPMPI